MRKKIFVRVQEQRAKSEKWNGKICPSIFKKSKASIARTHFVEVLWNGTYGFEVKHINGRGRQYTVNLDKGHAHVDTFSWQLFLAAMQLVLSTSVKK